MGCSWPTSCILNSQKKEEKFKPLYFARVQVNYCVILLCGKKKFLILSKVLVFALFFSIAGVEYRKNHAFPPRQ